MCRASPELQRGGTAPGTVQPITGAEPAATPTTMSCLVATTPWAGGRQLCRLLAATGAVGAPDAYFDPAGVDRRARAWKLVGGDPATLGARYLEAVLVASARGGPVCSVNLPWSHHRWLVHMARASVAAAGASGASDADVVAAWLPSPRYVHLRCRDTARQALRWSTAVHGRRSALGAAPDFQLVRWTEVLIDRHQRNWDAFFRLHRLDAYPVDYEDLLEEPERTVAGVVGWLGLGAAPIEGSASVVPHHASQQWVEEYSARREHLRASFAVA